MQVRSLPRPLSHLLLKKPHGQATTSWTMNMAQCTAKSKQSGERCKRHAAHGKKVCAIHGGKTPSGIASPHYKGRGHSDYLPKRLKARYEQSIGDPDLLNLNAEIALTDTRIAELLENLETGDVEHRWNKLAEAYGSLDGAAQAEDVKSWQEAHAELGRIIKSGVDSYAAWGQLNVLLETRRKLVETERKRRVEMQNMITAEQAMMLLREMMTVIHETVPEYERRLAIQTRFDRLLAAGN